MDMSAVGNAVQASKKSTGLSGREVFAGKGSFEQADNGGVIVRAQRTRQQEVGKDQSYPGYCEDAVYVFAKPEEAAAKIVALMRLPEGSPLPDADDRGGVSTDDAPPPANPGA